MKKKLLALFTLTGIGVIIFLLGTSKNIWSGVPAPQQAPERPIVISDIEPLKKLQEPQVTFYHAKHVTALEKEGCVACHPQDEKGRFEFQYPKTRNVKGKRSLMNAYHTSCLGCHQERAQKSEKAGPIACGECHVPKAE
ncbi:MAG: cytochrome c3 family protein, partial [Pseudomonadota bacterium]